MNILEEKLASLLNITPQQFQIESAAYAVLLDEFMGLPEGQRKVSDEVLLNLHQSFRFQPDEEYLWSLIIPILADPLPDTIAHDLIRRKLNLSALAHTRQSTSSLRLLAPLVDEALLTLAQELYANADYSTSDFKKLLEQYSSHHWMLEKLAYCSPSSPEKKAIFLDIVAGHPDREKLESLTQGMSDFYQQCEEEERQKAYNLQRAHESTGADEIRQLWKTNDPAVLLELTRNPSTPRNVLLLLSQVRKLNGAPKIRHGAKNALYRLGVRGTQ